VDASTVEPLGAAIPGREEARAQFIADAGGATESPPEAPPEPATVQTVSAEQVTELVVDLLDQCGRIFGPLRVGGTAELWAQTPTDRAMLVNAGSPVARKYLADVEVSIEVAALVAVALVYVPRTLAAAAQGQQRPPAPPPPPPAAPAPPTVTQTAAAPAPEPAPAPAAPRASSLTIDMSAVSGLKPSSR
jgi:hypothetical protein